MSLIEAAEARRRLEQYQGWRIPDSDEEPLPKGQCSKCSRHYKKLRRGLCAPCYVKARKAEGS